MNDRIVWVQRRIGAWFVARTAALRSDDRGAFTTETAIITGVLALLAVAVGVIITERATGWANAIPGSGD
jgi:Flp pilus assembly protein TadG